MKTLQVATNPSPSRAWMRALELTASIPKNPARIFPNVIEELAESAGNAPALLSDSESLSYRELAVRSGGYARWALAGGLKKGDVVCLLMPNRPEYMAIWLGLTSIGVVVALLNTNLKGASLAHCINIVNPKHIIVDEELLPSLETATPDISGKIQRWIHGQDLDGASGAVPGKLEPGLASLEDTALYIYTSGTTGLPKAARVSHHRVMQWSHWFAGMMDVVPADVMYNCLPMYHSVGGVVATGAVLAGGGAVAIRRSFSAREFWTDIARWDCTLFQYIGELCRYLLGAPPTPLDTSHRIRMCCGNGLRGDVWTDFTDRFRIPRVLEFYAATEGNFSLYNVDGKAGAIGRIPPFLAHRFPAALVRFDVEREAPVRNAEGFCLRCGPNEVGEAIGRIQQDGSSGGGRFEGYTSQEASEKKILRNVFESGDAWFRTGDLMRRDEKGYFYFVDRVGDTFRWKAENVATSEVSEAIAAFSGIKEANVYGVAVPGVEGRAGMAAIVADTALDLAALRNHLLARLPAYACPVFLRIQEGLQVTTTFKYTKSDLVRDGYDPSTTTDAIYFNDAERSTFVRLDAALHARILSGAEKL